MFDNYNSKKYIFLLVIICMVFGFLIIKAFDYLPDNQVEDIDNTETSNINKIIDNTTNKNYNGKDSEDEEHEDDSYSEKKINTKSGILYQDPLTVNSQEQIEEINAPHGSINETTIYNEEENNNHDNENAQGLSNDEKALRAIINARKLTKAGNQTDAINSYNKVQELTQDNELLSEAYEGIAELYAKDKKYGSALTFAAKAYKASPSLSGELLIAKIYYSAGKTDTAITRVNNMVKRGFTVKE